MLVNLKTYRLALKTIERALEAGHVLLRWRQLSINNVAVATDSIDPDNAIVPYRSTSKAHRLIVETSLITLCDTVSGTKVSSCNKDMKTIGPIILAASNIDWKLLASVQPAFNVQIIPRPHRKFFNLHTQTNNVQLTPSLVNPTHVPHPSELEQSRYRLRSGNISNHISSNQIF